MRRGTSFQKSDYKTQHFRQEIDILLIILRGYGIVKRKLDIRFQIRPSTNHFMDARILGVW